MNVLRIAITGANGQMGSFLVAYLRKRGHIVYELVRSKEKAKDTNYYQYFDLADPYHMPSFDNIDVLIHTAYFFDAINKDYTKINTLGTQALFRQARTDNVKYTIFISTISAHADAISQYGKVKYQLEILLQQEYDNVIIIRPGLIFSTPLQGIAGAMDNFIKRYPIVPSIGLGRQLIYPCFLEELALFLENLSILQPKINKPVVAASDIYIYFNDLIMYLARKRQKRILLLPIPFYGIYFLLRMIELFGINIGFRSDSLLGLQYANKHHDFVEAKSLGATFSGLGELG